MKRTSGWVMVAAVALFTSLGVDRLEAQSPRSAEAVPKDGGTIVGTVHFEGPIPKQKRLNVTAKVPACQREPILSETLVVSTDKGDKTVQWAVVSIKKIKGGKPFPKEDPDKPVSLEQKGCRFVPHVVVVPPRRTLRIFNRDGILHNVHVYARKNRPFNRAQPGRIKKIDVSFRRPERIRVGCNVHDWMTAWIIVAEHPYTAVTGSDGRFEFKNVPAGRHTIEIWHETLGKQEKEVTVTPGGQGSVDFVLRQK